MSEHPAAARLLLSRLPGETRAAWVDANGRLLAYRLQRDARAAVAGDLYKARISSLDHGLKAAFVSLGAEQTGFLPFDKKQRFQEGQAVVVRVNRAAAEDKGAKLTLVKDEGVLASLTDLDSAAVPSRLIDGDDLFARLGDKSQEAVAPALLPPSQEICCDDLAFFKTLQQRVAGQPALLALLQLHNGPTALFDPELEAQIEALGEPEVAVPGGAYLLIEPVRTLTAIDVNAGNQKAQGGRSISAVVNEAALAPLVRQIQLRDLSGQILVDFLQPESRKERQALAEQLERALAADPEPCQLERLGPGGLAEITRRRSRPPLHELQSVRAGRAGSGWQDSPLALAFALLREVKAAGPRARMTLEVSSAVERELKGEAAAAYKEINATLGGALRLVRVPGLADEQSNLRQA